MAKLRPNILLPVLVGVGLLTLGAVAAKEFFTDDGVKPQPRTSLPTPNQEPDGDTPADTIRTLNAKLEEVNQRLETVVGTNDALQADNKRLRDQESRLRNDLTKEVESQLSEAQAAQTSQWDSSVKDLGDQLEALKSSLTVDKDEQAPALNSDYPVTTGLQGPLGQDYVWVQPLDAAPVGLADAKASAPAAAGSGRLLPRFNPSGEADGLATEAEDLPSESAPIEDRPEDTGTVEPYFTINNLATLTGSTAFTAMIGRVPIGGQVSDPVPFRVLVGRENLAASGLRVPDDIAGMVFEGVGIGDWTLGCVEGSLRTATFIFDDGTIRTVSGGDDQSGRLGYIADRFGTPCVPGERVSNAGPYLAAQVGLAGAGAAAEAFAAAETTQVIDGGSIASAVTGDAATFALGRTASEATAQVQQYLADRLSSTFDAVYVAPGADLSLLIQQEITIDYDPKGRKLDYAKGASARTRPLD